MSTMNPWIDFYKSRLMDLKKIENPTPFMKYVSQENTRVYKALETTSEF